MTRLWIPLLVALLVGALWWLANGEPPASVPATTLSDSEHERDDVSAELVGRGAVPPPQAGAVQDATQSTATSAEPDASGHRLRGELLGIETGDAARASIDVALLRDGWSAPESPHVASSADASGHFDIDLGSLFNALDFAPSHLELTVDHPGHARVQQRIDLHFRNFDTAETYRATIQLRRAAIATGILTDARGDPLPGASVGLFPMDGDQPRLESVLPLQPVAIAQTDSAGRYRLRLAADGPHVLVAGIAGMIPCSKQLTLRVPETLEVEDLVLTAGVSITGTLESFGAAPVNGWVSALPTSDQDGRGLLMQIGALYFAWGREGAVRQGQVRAQTDVEGRYRLVGLPAGPCWLSVGAQLHGFDAITPAALRALEREEEAPTDHADFDIVGVRLIVRTSAQGEPPGKGSLMLSDAGSSASAAIRADGSVHALVAPLHDYKIKVQVPGFEHSTLAFRSPASGTHTASIALEPAAARPTLVVELRDASGAPVPGASFRLQHLDPSVDGSPGGRTEWLWPDGVAGVFRMEGLASGRISVTTMPWRTDWSESGYGIDIRRELTLPAVGEYRLVLIARRGGRLRIAARGKAGALLPAKCVIRNERGDAQVVNFATHSKSMSMSAPGALGRLSPSLVDPPLEPGTYSIELRHGDAAKTLSAIVKTGETTEVEVTLDSAPSDGD